jgi:uncharacterized protein YndB with AHSA1/START domain
MNSQEFVYTTYIKTSPEKVWNAITTPEFCRQYWKNVNISDWKQGSTWQHVTIDGAETVVVTGTVLESLPPKRLVLSWAAPEHAGDPSAHSRVSFDIDMAGDMVRLNVTHSGLETGSVMASRVSSGWPRVLCSLKSLLETGKALDTWADFEKSCA